ncbi:uncharacterized protein [Clytia hemisphaerica]|uniref:5'-AMP-activated protein kinase subunit beta-1 n=1 Tax=Clytia hemisphaerica TaxID=252671 RepID=A0A7M6DPF9_9CNID|eukprot:TCONS_00071424-protein
MGKGQSKQTFEENQSRVDGGIGIECENEMEESIRDVKAEEYVIKTQDESISYIVYNIQNETKIVPESTMDANNIVVEEVDYSLDNNKTLPIVFHWGYGGKEVFLSGSFYEWKKRVPMINSGDEYTTTVDLPSGTHEFKYIVDGHWQHDPNQNTVNDHFAGRNNILTVS